MRAIVTGASGFIGSAVVRRLLAEEADVLILQRPESDAWRLQGLVGFESLQCSYDDMQGLEQSIDDFHPDVFIHCAWRGVAEPDRSQSFQITQNLPFTLQTVELAAALGCRQWIGLGSQAEYGFMSGPVDEDHPANPTSVYGQAKLSSGIAATALCESLNMSGTWLRVFSVYGPFEGSTMLSYVRKELAAGNSPKLTDCSQQWDYLYVDDAAEAIVATAKQNEGGVFNLGFGAHRPLKEYIAQMQDVLQTEVQPDYGAVAFAENQIMHLEADISKLKRATGWAPATEFESGIAQTIAMEQAA